MKKIFWVTLLVLLIPCKGLATESIVKDQLEVLELSSFINEGEKYIEEVFPEINVEDLITKSISGDVNNSILYKSILKVLGKEIVTGITSIGYILVIVVIHSILKSIGENLGNDSVSKIAYFIEYILIVTIILNSFVGIVTNITETITNLVAFMNSLVPILMSLIIATGQVATSTAIQPILILIIVFIGNVINLIVLPVITTTMILTIVSNISEKIQIDNLSKFLKSSVTWFLVFTITIFAGVLSLEGTLVSSVDGTVVKGIKLATSTFIPVLGKALGDSVDTVLGATSLIKNAIGFVGIVIIIGICVLPIIKLTILSIMYSLAGAISEPLADKKIVNVINQMAGIFKILLGIMFFMAVLLIIGVALTLKISNISLMYR